MAKLLPSFLLAAAAVSYMMHMIVEDQLVGIVVDVVVVVVNHPLSCKETVAEEVLAAIVLDSSAGRVKYLLVNLTNNGSSSAVCSATENADL